MNRKNITGKHITKHWFSIQTIKLKIPSDNLVFNFYSPPHYYGIWRPFFLSYLMFTVSDHYKNEQKLGSVQTEQNYHCCFSLKSLTVKVTFELQKVTCEFCIQLQSSQAPTWEIIYKLSLQMIASSSRENHFSTTTKHTVLLQTKW